MKKLTLSLLSISILIFMCSWGFLVHRTIHQLAVYQLPVEIRPFFFKEMKYLVYNAPRPDIRRKDDKEEETKHFIDFENYGEHAENNMPRTWNEAVAIFGEDSLKKNGWLPFVIINTQNQLTEAFRKGNRDSVLFYAADLGHYIGDAHVPLHTTANYDGQMTNQKGIHSLWESMVPELELETYTLRSRHQARYIKHQEKAIWNTLQASYTMVANLLEMETAASKFFTEEQKLRVQIRNGKERKGYTTEFALAYAEKLQPTINKQLVAASEMIADFWYTAWVNAGKPDLDKLGWNQLNEEQKTSLEKEVLAYKEDSLISRKLLRSKQEEEKKNKKED